jgi:hypothetical protein
LYVDATPTIAGPLAIAFQFLDSVADIPTDEQTKIIPTPIAAPKRTIIRVVPD